MFVYLLVPYIQEFIKNTYYKAIIRVCIYGTLSEFEPTWFITITIPYIQNFIKKYIANMDSMAIVSLN